MGVNKEDNHVSIMEAALEIASKEMGTLVALRDQQLKVLYTTGLEPVSAIPKFRLIWLLNWKVVVKNISTFCCLTHVSVKPCCR